MSTVQNLNCYLEYDEGVMEIVIIDAVIQMGIHAWGSTLNLSLERDGANLIIKNNAAQQSVHLTASGAGGRGQNSLQSIFIADDLSAKHGGR